MPATAAFAHEDRLLGPVHWHASDVAGLLLVGALAVLAVWLGGKGGGKDGDA